MTRELSETEKAFFTALLLSMGLDGLRVPEELAHLGKPGWRIVTIPDGAALGKATFADFAAVVKACGDDELVIADIYSPQPNQHLVACGVDYYELKNALASNPDFTTFDVCVVGRSGRWAMILKGLDIGFLAAERDVLRDELFGPGLRH
ncbi:MAG TPA: hypothetical protein VFP68_14710 [Burkholderiaceae bacterium]|nr:hypothetical protein [Burkholderiaceae bacterium]